MFERRLEVLEAIMQFTHAEFLNSGWPEPSRMHVDVFVTTVEHISYRVYTDTEGTSEDVADARRLMLRIADASLRHSARLSQRPADQLTS